MSLNDLLLVSRNYRGLCEENFLSTLDEFIEKYCSENSFGWTDVEGLKQVVLDAKPYEWNATFYAWGNDSYDMRLCQDEEDLYNFLSGEYNDSIDDMENRNPGTAGLYDNWYWENVPKNFSVLAIDIVKSYIDKHSFVGQEFKNRLLSVMPDFPFKSSDSLSKGVRLADVIKDAEQAKKSPNNVVGFSIPLEL